jgi:alkanesulfonate monooxygenase SsuD/methylene tetrahydromethanopterin reductase-like flavin-dependent oxidoreductase (luciferase family)
MPRISIAMSGGPNPAEIIDLVVLAERLGYESAWVAEGMAATHAPSWRPAPCGPRASWGQGHAIFHIPPDSYEITDSE